MNNYSSYLSLNLVRQRGLTRPFCAILVHIKRVEFEGLNTLFNRVFLRFCIPEQNEQRVIKRTLIFKSSGELVGSWTFGKLAEGAKPVTIISHGFLMSKPGSRCFHA